MRFLAFLVCATCLCLLGACSSRTPTACAYPIIPVEDNPSAEVLRKRVDLYNAWAAERNGE